MRRRFSHVPSAGNQMSSLLRHSINSNPRPSAMVGVSQHGISSPRNSHGNRMAGVNGGGQSSKSTVRKKDAERLAEQRQQLARRLSGALMNSSLHSLNSPSVKRDDSQYSARKHRVAINLAHINSIYRSNKSSFRDVIVDAPSPSSGDHNILNDLRGTVPTPVVSVHASIPLNPFEVPSNEVSEKNDADAAGVGPSPGLAVATNEVNRSGDVDGGDVDGKQGATLEEANDKEKNDRPTPLLRQSSKSPVGNAQSRVPSGNKLQASKIPSNRAIPIISDEGEETRSPTSTSPRRGSRQPNVVYTGASSHT